MDAPKELQRYVLIGGQVYKPRPGHAFQITEVQLPLSDAEMREVGQPGWPYKTS